MNRDQLLRHSVTDRDLFVDGDIWRYGEWIVVNEWIAHEGLSLAPDWLNRAMSPTRHMCQQLALHLDRYLEAVNSRDRIPVRFNPPKIVEGDWRYQSVRGKAPLEINADIRDLMERLTPGSRWYMAETATRYNGERVTGHVFGRVHPVLGVRCVVAGADPRRAA
jgi:hypothetical protein